MSEHNKGKKPRITKKQQEAQALMEFMEVIEFIVRYPESFIHAIHDYGKVLKESMDVLQGKETPHDRE